MIIVGQDRRQESCNTKYPFTMDSTMKMPVGIFKPGSIEAMQLYLRDGCMPPVYLYSMQVAGDTIKLTFNDANQNEFYASVQDGTTTAQLISDEGLISGWIQFADWFYADMFAVIKYSCGGSFTSNSGDFKLLPDTLLPYSANGV